MKTKTLLIAAAVALLSVTPVAAKCGPIANLADGYWFDSISESGKDRVIGYDEGNGYFFVVVQNQKTCKIKSGKMHMDQLSDKYGLSDELETGCVDGCD